MPLGVNCCLQFSFQALIFGINMHQLRTFKNFLLLLNSPSALQILSDKSRADLEAWADHESRDFGFKDWRDALAHDEDEDD